MGWWSASIMGGDEPLDARAELLRQFGLTSEQIDSFEASPEQFRDRLEQRCEAVRDALLRGIPKNDPNKRPVLWQVFGHILLDAGADVRSIAEHVRTACAHDGWAQEGDSERVAAVSGLAGMLNARVAAHEAEAAAREAPLVAERQARQQAVDSFLAGLAPHG